LHLSPHEQECLLPSCAAEPARCRAARGLELDLPEATAIVPEELGKGQVEATFPARLDMAAGSRRPLLHTTVGPGPGAPAWLPPVTSRAYASVVHPDGEKAQVAAGEDAVRPPMPGGWVTTPWGAQPGTA
jgi:urease accessory protein